MNKSASGQLAHYTAINIALSALHYHTTHLSHSKSRCHYWGYCDSPLMRIKE